MNNRVSIKKYLFKLFLVEIVTNFIVTVGTFFTVPCILYT